MSEQEWLNCKDHLPEEMHLVEVREKGTMQTFRLQRVMFCWYTAAGFLFDGFEITHWREINGGLT